MVYVDNVENLDKLMNVVCDAQKEYSTFSQEHVDKIFQACTIAANQNRFYLAEVAYNEAGMGVLEDKVLKNHFSSEIIYNAYKDMKTCDVVETNEAGGFTLYAEPLGILAGIVPCTNPTSTTLFKALLAIKTRNAIVFSPHPRTVQCTKEAARIIREAAHKAGAPDNLIHCIDKVSMELCNSLMHHQKIAMIVATGAGGLVKAAYSSGKPCAGGGSGNTPVIIDETADIALAVNSILLSKTFDNGMICASEQAIVCVKEIAQKVKDELTKRGAFFITEQEEKNKLSKILFNENGTLNPPAVGQAATKLAQMANLKNFKNGSLVIIAEIKDIGVSEPLSREKLCPCLSFFTVDTYQDALNHALKLVQFGGMGHTSVLYTNLKASTKHDRIAQFQAKIPTGRTLICMPASQGAIGGVYNTYQKPSMSLGCGSWGGNASAEGLQPKHLINYKQVAERRNMPVHFKVPENISFGTNIIQDALKQVVTKKSLKRALILRGSSQEAKDVSETAKTILEQFGVLCSFYSNLNNPLSIQCVKKGVVEAQNCHADVLVAIGNNSVLEGSKLIRALVEDPNQDLVALSTNYLNLNKKVKNFSSTGKTIKCLMCIPVTSGSGAEMTTYATAIDENKVYTFADYNLLPDVSIVDFDVVKHLNKSAAAESGFEALSNAFESLVSLIGTDYTRNLSLEAVELLVDNLLLSVTTGDIDARAACHRAASLAGMACANAALGLCESLAHQLMLHFKMPKGISKAMVMSQVVKFNAEDAPTKLGTHPQYEKPKAKHFYATALKKTHIVNNSDTEDHVIEVLVDQINKLKSKFGILSSLKEYGIKKDEYMKVLNEMAKNAFNDQYTGSNPRLPLIKEIEIILINAYEGNVNSIGLDSIYMNNN